ncbi:hypothetical protein [Marinomonas sp. 2405UD68-3]|uniref:hypothetical protein n=1 Tax=Marinomonas sp. 2405UD68-3 TaxID=3391835 RepID=UPI0039C8D181
MLTSHFSEMPRLLTFFLSLFLAFSVNAVEPAQAGYYWEGFNLHGSSPSGVAVSIQNRVGFTTYCASYDLKPFGDPIAYSMTCYRSSGSSYNSYNIVKSFCSSSSDAESCQVGYQPPVEMCSDGFPPNVYGYEDNCDRPTPKKCDSGEYVEERAYCSVSNGICSDYDSCYQYAITNANCSSSSSRFSFNYRDPNNWDYSCGDIDPASPDHPNNGGNADGNEYNDPQSPEPPISSGNSDPSVLAAAIGLELRSDFGNVERAIRDGISSADSNVNRTIDAINSAQSNLNSTLSDIKSSIQEGHAADNGSSSIIDSVNSASSSISGSINQSSSDISNNIANSSSDIVDSVNGLNNSVSSGNGIISSQLAGISSKLDNLKTCDPNLDPQSCEGEHGITSGFITNVMDTLVGVFNDENEAALDSVKSEITTIESASPLKSSVIEGIFDPILHILPQPQECIPLIFGNQSQPYSFTLSCDFSDKFKAVFGFLLAFYTIQQLIGIIISSAQPRQEGS